MRTVLAAMLIAFTPMVGAQEAAPPPPGARILRAQLFEALKEPRDVVMVGDSLTERGEWSELLPGVRVANRGIGGNTTADLVARVNVTLAVQPKRVYVMAGINDLIPGRLPVPVVLDRYRELIDALGASGAKVTVQSTLYIATPRASGVNPRVQALNVGLQHYCAIGHCSYLDINAQLAPGGFLLQEYSGDGVHLAAAGYIAWAKLILAQLQD